MDLDGICIRLPDRRTTIYGYFDQLLIFRQAIPNLYGNIHGPLIIPFKL